MVHQSERLRCRPGAATPGRRRRRRASGNDRLAQGERHSGRSPIPSRSRRWDPASGAASRHSRSGGRPRRRIVDTRSRLIPRLSACNLRRRSRSANSPSTWPSGRPGSPSYVGKAIHSGFGFVFAWVYPFGLPLRDALPLAWCSGTCWASTIYPSLQKARGSPSPGWPATAACIARRLSLLNYFGIKVRGPMSSSILGVFEIAVFVILAVVLDRRGPAHTNNLLRCSRPAEAETRPGFHGLSGGRSPGPSTGFLAFIGFEAGCLRWPRETKNPRRNIPRAIIGARASSWVSSTC